MQRDKVNHADKGWKETLLDGYTEQEFERVCRELWARGAGSPECHFRALVDLLLGHYMLAHGGDRRNAELSDLLTFKFTGDGLTRCMPLIFTTRARRQNKHGRLETAGALRNRRATYLLVKRPGLLPPMSLSVGDRAVPGLQKALYMVRYPAAKKQR